MAARSSLEPEQLLMNAIGTKAQRAQRIKFQRLARWLLILRIH